MTPQQTSAARHPSPDAALSHPRRARVAQPNAAANQRPPSACIGPRGKSVRAAPMPSTQRAERTKPGSRQSVSSRKSIHLAGKRRRQAGCRRDESIWRGCRYAAIMVSHRPRRSLFSRSARRPLSAAGIAPASFARFARSRRNPLRFLRRGLQCSARCFLRLLVAASRRASARSSRPRLKRPSALLPGLRGLCVAGRAHSVSANP